jgi:CheY-like chemotaxis protein
MLKEKIVLIAEDDLTMQIFTGGVLRQELNCHNLIIYTNGLHALSALKNPKQNSPINLILCDLEMHGANGGENFLPVRKDKDICHIPSTSLSNIF